MSNGCILGFAFNRYWFTLKNKSSVGSLFSGIFGSRPVSSYLDNRFRVPEEKRKFMAAFDFGRKVEPDIIENLLSRDYHIDSGAALRKAWEMFMAHVAEFAGFALILFLIYALSSRMSGAGSLLLSLVSGPLYAGYAIVTFRLLAGREFRFNDFFAGFSFFLPLLLTGLASGLIVATGMVLLLIPGIYFLVSYLFAVLFVIDYGMEFWQAMETSRKLVSKHWFSCFGFVLVIILVNLLGLLALGIGLLVTYPVTACATAIVYRSIVGDREGESHNLIRSS
jgi:hypothetical protein